MGWFDGTSSSKGYIVRKRSPRRASSVYSSTHHSRHSAPSIFSLGGRINRSTSSFFSSSSSSRRARPRSGFIQRIVHRIKRLLRHIYHYAQRHPIKVFLLVIVPLITGGILQKLLATIGIRLPRSLRGKSASSSGFGSAGGSGLSESVHGLMTIAKMFM
ncbi:hypothetical protein VTN96DRAFT_2879 [Rasamsonia emersonii]